MPTQAQQTPDHDPYRKWRAFISLSRWTFAKTYAKKAPHEYTLRDRTHSDATFCEFVQFIRDHGEKRYFWRKQYTYLMLDGWEYWTMGNPINETTVINRARPNDSSNR